METEFNLSVCPICTKKFIKHYKQVYCNNECKLKGRKLKDAEYRKRNLRYFADKTKEYAHNNKDKIKKKAERRYNQPEEKKKALIRAKTRNSNEKTGICFDCKEKAKTGFHHLSYEPNIFIELCKKCHNKRHGRNYYGR